MDNKGYKYDVEGLAAELEVDLESIVGLFSSYFEEMKEEVSSMQELLSKNDWYMLARVIHNIKGVSANLSIQDVFDEAAAFDSRLKLNNTNNATTYVEKIMDLISKAEIEIMDIFKEKGLSL